MTENSCNDDCICYQRK